jgi:uncharacterized membrane protein YqjE
MSGSFLPFLCLILGLLVLHPAAILVLILFLPAYGWQILCLNLSPYFIVAYAINKKRSAREYEMLIAPQKEWDVDLAAREYAELLAKQQSEDA